MERITGNIRKWSIKFYSQITSKARCDRPTYFVNKKPKGQKDLQQVGVSSADIQKSLGTFKLFQEKPELRNAKKWTDERNDAHRTGIIWGSGLSKYLQP